MKLWDSLVSLVSGMGTARDKTSTVAYRLRPFDGAELDAMYRSAWLPRKIVDIPAEDACRRWRDWQATPEQITAIEEEEKRLGLQGKVLEAMKRARLRGGCALYIGDGTTDPTQPLDPESIKKGGIQYITVVPRIQLGAGNIISDVTNPGYNTPEFYTVNGQLSAVNVHPSRLVIFQGADRLEDAVTDGWSDSVLQIVYDAVRNADSSFANVASLIFEAKVDVLRIPSFMASLADAEYRSRMIDRTTLAATAKGVNGMLLLDKEEEYEQKDLKFGSLPELLDRFVQATCGAADIPATRLWGQSPAGMNATGESDLRNYYDGRASYQNLEMTPRLHILDECLIRSALGSRDPDIHYIWAPLWQVSAKEQSEIGVAAANTIKTLADTGLWHQEALATAGANMLVERSVLPGFEQAIDDAPEYDPSLEPADPNADPNAVPAGGE